MKVGDLVEHRCGNCVYFRATPVPKPGLCTVYNRNTTSEDSCEHFANTAVKGKFRELECSLNGETKNESR